MRERDCGDEVELRNGKANPFGWSTAELWHNEERIGDQYCGAITITHPDYRYTIEPEGDHKRLRVFCKTNEPEVMPL